MQEVIDRVMRAYGLMVPLTPKEEELARQRLADFLRDRQDNANRLSVEGMKFLRGKKTARTRRPPKI
jgi:hypothetical protein